MTNLPTPEHKRLAREGMYHSESEHDACGIGLLEAGIEALKAVWHRRASLDVWAIRDGRDVTEHLHRWMAANAVKERVAA